MGEIKVTLLDFNVLIGLCVNKDLVIIDTLRIIQTYATNYQVMFGDVERRAICLECLPETYIGNL